MAAILALEKISKRFGAVVVADNIDLSLNDGEALGIIGPNGAGKTTLFGIATGTVRPDSGRVLFADNEVTRLPAERRCRMGLARSFQIPQPFSGMSVFENVVVAAAFGAGEREAAVYDRCAGLLERCGLAEKANRRAGGLCSIKRLDWPAPSQRAHACCCSMRSPAASPVRMLQRWSPFQDVRAKCLDHLDQARRARFHQSRSARGPARRQIHRRRRPAQRHS
jgi:hypothetical protein